jgi:hypothetical protein
MAKISNIDTGKVDLNDFISKVDAGIVQSESDAITINEATTLAQLKPVLDHINNRQLEIMKALRYLATRINNGGA